MRWAGIFFLGVFLVLGACGDEKRGKSTGEGGEGGSGGMGGGGEAGAGGAHGGSGGFGGEGGDGGGGGQEEGPHIIHGRLSKYSDPSGKRVALDGNFDKAVVTDDEGRFTFIVDELPYRLTVDHGSRVFDYWGLSEKALLLPPHLLPWHDNVQELEVRFEGEPDPLPERHSHRFGHPTGLRGVTLYPDRIVISPSWTGAEQAYESVLFALLTEYDEAYFPARYWLARTPVVLATGGAPQSVTFVMEEIAAQLVQLAFDLEGFGLDAVYWGARIEGADVELGEWSPGTDVLVPEGASLFLEVEAIDADDTRATWSIVKAAPSATETIRPPVYDAPRLVAPEDGASGVGEGPVLEWTPTGEGLQVLEVSSLTGTWRIHLPPDADRYDFSEQDPSWVGFAAGQTYRWSVALYPGESVNRVVTGRFEGEVSLETKKWSFTVD